MEDMPDDLESTSFADDDLREAKHWRTMIQDQNRKNKKSGGFQAMGKSRGVKEILRRP